MYTFSIHIHKIQIFFWHHMTICQVYCWIVKDTSKGFSCVMVFTMTPSSTSKFQFIFGFNECFRAIFFFIKYLVLYLRCGCVILFYNKNDFESPLTSCRWIKNLSAKTTKHISKIERSIKRKSFLNFIRVIRKSSFDQHFLYIWSKRFWELFSNDFLISAQNISSLAVELSCVRHEIFQLFQCYYTIIQIAFSL